MRALMLVGLVAALAVPSTAAAQDPVKISTRSGSPTGHARTADLGEPEHYSLPGEEMPPSRSIVAKGPSDTQDSVSFRMPNTSGTVANLAAFHGQTVIAQHRTSPYAKVHFFGTTTDGGPAGGVFVLRYPAGTTDTRTVRFRDWCNAGGATPPTTSRWPLTHRWTETGQDGARCGTTTCPRPPTRRRHRVGDAAVDHHPGSDPIQGYLMALTLEKSS